MMLRTTITKIKKVCVQTNPHFFLNSNRSGSSRFQKFIPGSSKAGKSSKKNALSKDEECETCKKLIAYLFGKDETLVEQIRTEVPETEISHVQKLPRDEICQIVNQPNKPEKTELIDDLTSPLENAIVQATTAKQTEEQLAQKIEVIKEPSLVEAAKSNIEGFNITPRILGNVSEKESSDAEAKRNIKDVNVLSDSIKKQVHELINDIERTQGLIDSLVRKIENKEAKVEDKGEINDSYDELAKRCLGAPNEQVDSRLLQEMEKCGVPHASPRAPRSEIDEEMVQVQILNKNNKPKQRREVDLEIRAFDRQSPQIDVICSQCYINSTSYTVNTPEVPEYPLQVERNIIHDVYLKPFNEVKEQTVEVVSNVEEKAFFTDLDVKPYFDPSRPIIDPYDKKTLSYEKEEDQRYTLRQPLQLQEQIEMIVKDYNMKNNPSKKPDVTLMSSEKDSGKTQTPSDNKNENQYQAPINTQQESTQGESVPISEREENIMKDTDSKQMPEQTYENIGEHQKSLLANRMLLAQNKPIETKEEYLAPMQPYEQTEPQNVESRQMEKDQETIKDTPDEPTKLNEQYAARNFTSNWNEQYAAGKNYTPNWNEQYAAGKNFSPNMNEQYASGKHFASNSNEQYTASKDDAPNALPKMNEQHATSQKFTPNSNEQYAASKNYKPNMNEQYAAAKNYTSNMNEQYAAGNNYNPNMNEQYAAGKHFASNSNEQNAASKNDTPNVLPKMNEQHATSQNFTPNSNEQYAASKNFTPNMNEQYAAAKNYTSNMNEQYAGGKNYNPSMNEQYAAGKNYNPNMNEQYATSKNFTKNSNEQYAARNFTSNWNEQYATGKNYTSNMNEQHAASKNDTPNVLPKMNEQNATSQNFTPNSNEQYAASQNFSPNSIQQYAASKNFTPNMNEQYAAGKNYTPSMNELYAATSTLNPKPNEQHATGKHHIPNVLPKINEQYASSKNFTQNPNQQSAAAKNYTPNILPKMNVQYTPAKNTPNVPPNLNEQYASKPGSYNANPPYYQPKEHNDGRFNLNHYQYYNTQYYYPNANNVRALTKSSEKKKVNANIRIVSKIEDTIPNINEKQDRWYVNLKELIAVAEGKSELTKGQVSDCKETHSYLCETKNPAIVNPKASQTSELPSKDTSKKEVSGAISPQPQTVTAREEMFDKYNFKQYNDQEHIKQWQSMNQQYNYQPTPATEENKNEWNATDEQSSQKLSHPQFMVNSVSQNVWKYAPDINGPETAKQEPELKPDMCEQKLNSTKQSLQTVCGPLPKLQLDPETIPLSELLKRVRIRNRMELCQAFEKELRPCIDPVEDKCGKSKPCPPPPPKCPPPPPPKPPECPPPPPRCPQPCKPKCPPQKPPCPCPKFKKINLGTLKDIISILCRTKPMVLKMKCYENTEDYEMAVAQNLIEMDQVESLCLYLEEDPMNFLKFAREYDPWVPIPSWPTPKKPKKKSLQCPKDGCKLVPPPRPEVPCKPYGCKGFPNKLRMTDVFTLPL